MSANTRDFAKSKAERGVLHDDLSDQLRKEGLVEDSVILINSLSDFNHEFVQPAMNNLVALANLLLAEEHESLSLRDLLESEIDNALESLADDINPDALGLAEEVESCSYAGETHVMEIINVEANLVEDDFVLISTDAYMLADFELSIDGRSNLAWSWGLDRDARRSSITRTREFFTRTQSLVNVRDGSSSAFDLIQLGEYSDSWSINLKLNNDTSSSDQSSALRRTMARQEHQNRHTPMLFTPKSTLPSD